MSNDQLVEARRGVGRVIAFLFSNVTITQFVKYMYVRNWQNSQDNLRVRCVLDIVDYLRPNCRDV